MSEITQVEAIQKALVGIIGAESAEKVANLKGEKLEKVYSLVFEQASYYDVLPKEITVKGLVQELYELSEVEFSDSFTVIELQDLILQQVTQLSELLGIEPEELED